MSATDFEFPDFLGDEIPALQRLTVDQLIAIRRYCGVCIGHSPSWDGHETNPPCQGAARDEIMRRARQWNSGAQG